jgi:hypothetical protein
MMSCQQRLALPHAQIAVPTSAGYGSGALAGLAPLLGAASLAPGVTTVGLDNGAAAASAAARLLRAANRLGAAMRAKAPAAATAPAPLPQPAPAAMLAHANGHHHPAAQLSGVVAGVDMH